MTELMSNGALFELINAAGDAVFVADGEGRLLSLNDAGAGLLGYAGDAGLASIPPDFLSRSLDWPALTAQTDVSGEAGTSMATLRNAGGESLLVKVIVLPRVKHGAGYVCMIRDVTVQNSLAKNLVERNTELEILRDLAVESMRVADQEALLDSMVQLCAQATGASGGAIFLYNPATKCLELRASVGMDETFRNAVSTLRLGEGIAGKVAVSRAPILIDDLSSNPDVSTEMVRRQGVRNFACFPLLVGNRLVGVIFFFTREAAALTGRDFSLLSLLSAQVSLSLDHIMRMEEVRERNEELEDFNRLAVDRELRMIELKKRIRELEGKLVDEAG